VLGSLAGFMEIITLRAGDTSVQLAPAAGGAVTRYWTAHGATVREWLRPTPPGALDQRLPYQASAFPLVPYSNRIRDGRFAFEGRSVVQPLNRPPERHCIHGHAWQESWRPIEVQAAAALLEYRHPADAWPWAYRATQSFILGPSSLAVELALSNESATPMPAGLGWHPYFPRTPRATVTASVGAMWLTDDEMLPTALVAPPPAADPARGLAVDAVALDNCFTGWSHRAIIDWPELGARLVMAADPPLDFIVVFTPAGRTFFCAEPVSHVTDAFNLAAAGRTDTGSRTLSPGETLRATITLTPAS
jgi:aldose 1-epimerase